MRRIRLLTTVLAAEPSTEFYEYYSLVVPKIFVLGRESGWGRSVVLRLVGGYYVLDEHPSSVLCLETGSFVRL
jgi:hypothetical protein